MPRVPPSCVRSLSVSLRKPVHLQAISKRSGKPAYANQKCTGCKPRGFPWADYTTMRQNHCCMERVPPLLSPEERTACYCPARIGNMPNCLHPVKLFCASACASYLLCIQHHGLASGSLLVTPGLVALHLLVGHFFVESLNVYAQTLAGQQTTKYRLLEP